MEPTNLMEMFESVAEEITRRFNAVDDMLNELFERIKKHEDKQAAEEADTGEENETQT